MKKFLFSALLLFLCLANVNAETFYTNNNGVELNETQYSRLSKIYSTKYIERVLTQEDLDNFLSLDIINTSNIYEKTTYMNGTLVNRELITEEEYNNASTGEDNQTRGSAYIETNYKRLTVVVTNIEHNHYSLLSILDWKRVPVTRSYDVYALMVNNLNYYDVFGTQYYYVDSNFGRIDYDHTSAGYKHLSNGAGFSMNLKDGTNITDYEMILCSELFASTTQYLQANLWVSYQHAQADLTRASSMQYTFGVNGLGNVFEFTYNTTRNKYDSMPGVSVNLPIN